MFKAFGQWLKQLFGAAQPDQPGTASLPQAESNSQMAEQFDSIDAASHLVPYDENLLERARTQWQFGDWHSLAKLDRDTLQHHPDRAKLALLAAAGRLQIGQDSEVRQFIRLAQDWGCSKKQISQVLISGVHNTIGMAAAIGGQQQRSALHFEKAISVGSSSSDIQLLTQVRKSHQTSKMDLFFLSLPITLENSKKHINIEKRAEAYQSLNNEFYINNNYQNTIDGKNIKNDDILHPLKKSIYTFNINTNGKLEALLSIEGYIMETEKIKKMHGFYTSPEIYLYLINEITSSTYNMVIQFGVSPFSHLIAKAMEQISKLDHSSAKTEFLIIENENYNQTKFKLLKRGFYKVENLYLTKNVPYQGVNGEIYNYYDCQKILNANSKKYSEKENKKILALINYQNIGTSCNSIYPALPILLKCFPGFNINLIIVNHRYNKSSEEDFINKWLKELEIKILSHAFDIDIKYENICMLRITFMSKISAPCIIKHEKINM